MKVAVHARVIGHNVSCAVFVAYMVIKKTLKYIPSFCQSPLSFPTWSSTSDKRVIFAPATCKRELGGEGGLVQ